MITGDQARARCLNLNGDELHHPADDVRGHSWAAAPEPASRGDVDRLADRSFDRVEHPDLLGERLPLMREAGNNPRLLGEHLPQRGERPVQAGVAGGGFRPAAVRSGHIRALPAAPK